jgi:hypothetical protein
MKVSKLIELLQKVEDKEASVKVVIRQYNKRYPVHYGDVFSGTDYLTQVGGEVRIMTSLPDNMYTVSKKEVGVQS